MSIPVVTITSMGVVVPSFSDTLEGLKTSYKSIFGSDAYLEGDSQDGQWLAILAQSYVDCGNAVAQSYLSMSPATAQGVALSNNVKLNGIKRDPLNNSTADLTIIGIAGTPIINGQAVDENNNKWALPPSFTIPGGGSIVETATCLTLGAVTAVAGSINKIFTPTNGWQSVTNIADAVVGIPVETDPLLRVRQSRSVALPSLTVFEGTVGAVSSVPGVTAIEGYENDTNSTDSNGIPEHSISIVAQGGDAVAIAQAIASKKTPGTGTYGTTSELVTDSRGVANTIRFYRPTAIPIKFAITVKALTGYTTGYGDLIKASLANFINTLTIGEDILYTKTYVPANLPGTIAGDTFNVTSLTIGKVSGGLGTSDIVIAFNELPTCQVSDIALTVI